MPSRFRIAPVSQRGMAGGTNKPSRPHSQVRNCSSGHKRHLPSEAEKKARYGDKVSAFLLRLSGVPHRTRKAFLPSGAQSVPGGAVVFRCSSGGPLYVRCASRASCRHSPCGRVGPYEHKDIFAKSAYQAEQTRDLPCDTAGAPTGLLRQLRNELSEDSRFQSSARQKMVLL